MTKGGGNVLIDSSAWVQFLRRKGDPAAKLRVRDLIAGGQAVWCPVILLELWRGCSNQTDRDELRELQAEITSLEMSDQVWNLSFDIAAKCRPNGLVIPPTDLLIFACAQIHQVEMYHFDKHFAALGALV